MITDRTLWAKFARDGNTIVRWHSLVDHSADVAAVLEALLALPIVRRRLATTAGLADLDPVTCLRLAALAFLHDIGKANRGFRARVDPKARPVGHIHELSWVFNGERASALCERLVDGLGLERLDPWFGGDCWAMLEALFAHHGRPWKRKAEAASPPPSLDQWKQVPGSDPIADLAPIRERLDAWFAAAFGDSPGIATTPAFQHCFAGLLMLADWLGSNDDEAFFPYADGQAPDRMAWARVRAPQSLRAVGLAVEPQRVALRTQAPDFRTAFGFETARSIQTAVADAPARLLVLEAETGSGKTEAALWRFKRLFEQGLVDGLYFALPTRVAATQIFERVKAFRDRIFAQGDRPGVVLAVPGQTRFDEAEAIPLPGFEVQWSDDERAPQRWAAEHPKRFLAATIAVGTIDQALLGAVKVKHAHMRGSLLLRQLLVVDEVHASSVYSGELLRHLLRFHIGAGGHALLMSATLGGAMRARLLGTPEPNADTAAATAYPSLSWAEAGREVRREIASDGERHKTVAVEPAAILQDAAAVAAMAAEAARRGAAVLVVRNTVAAAMETARALEAIVGADSPLLFRVEGIATLHHSRFALEDRRLLDAAVEASMGKARDVGRGVVVVGTQTLEVSLDLDADLLLSDLCPIDVLLQRIGRLHRHSGRARPAGFEEPRTIVLVPQNRDLLAASLTRHGLGPTKDGGGIYPDLRVIEATWRLCQAHPMWEIPAMNRALVEGATHPEHLAAIERADPRFAVIGDSQSGRDFAHLQVARHALLDRSVRFDKCEMPRDDHYGTRLGEDDRWVAFEPPRMGPFGKPVTGMRLPAFLTRDIPADAEPNEIMEGDRTLTFRFGTQAFDYSRLGAVRVA